MMGKLIFISNSIKYILFLFYFSFSIAYANENNSKYSINNLLDKIAETQETQTKVIETFRKSLNGENKKINQKTINEYSILSKKYNNYVYLINSKIINDISTTPEYDKEKINRILSTSENYTNSMLLLLDEDLVFSEEQPNDIGYALSKVFPRYIEIPSFLAQKKQIEENKKIWDSYKSTMKSLFSLEFFLREVACGKTPSIENFANRHQSFILEQNKIDMFARLAAEERPNQGLYYMIYKTVIYQCLYIYEQSISINSKKYENIINKITSTCEDIFDQAGMSDYIIRENEKIRYVNALKISGKLIIPEVADE